MKCVIIYFVFSSFIAGVVLPGLEERFRHLYTDALKCKFNKSLDLDVSDTKVYFYDFTNNIYIVCKIRNAVDCITEALTLDLSKILVVFVPGYKGYINRDIEESFRQAYKDVQNIYLIIIDHSAYTYETEEKLRCYERSVLYSYYIGKALGGLLAEFKRKGYSSRNFHCIGHSMGAHIVGYAGDSYFAEILEKIWKITGLDPAGPCFANATLEEQLRSGNADYVEVYHCNAGHLGTNNVIGDIDFFFNEEGKIQPDCRSLNEEYLDKCYHKACVKYWTKTVHQPNLYSALACPTYEAFSEGLCNNNKTTMAGNSNPGNATGIFYVSTESDQGS
ncbi:unnamed protein product [Parnassius mnemosyne]|uniref:Lipase domain-containing protein n=1 Tax=Parnassius mnemosyne TaxID=213953 RepID=A0AAV1LU63_9NEOP